MRHLGSLLLALVAAPVAFVLAGRGLVGLAEAAETDRTDYIAIVFSGTALGFTGLLLGLLTMARISPVGPVLAGAGYLAVGIWALNDPDQLLANVPSRYVGLDDAQLAASAQVAPLLAGPLLLTLFIPRRWRGRERPEPAPVGYEEPRGYDGWAAPEPPEPPYALVAPPAAPAPQHYPTAFPRRPTSAPPRPAPAPPRAPAPVVAPPPYEHPAAPRPAGPQPGDEPTDVLPNDDPTATPANRTSPPSEQTTTNLHHPAAPPWPPTSAH